MWFLGLSVPQAGIYSVFLQELHVRTTLCYHSVVDNKYFVHIDNGAQAVSDADWGPAILGFFQGILDNLVIWNKMGTLLVSRLQVKSVH
jgi:hypothetical protein